MYCRNCGSEVKEWISKTCEKCNTVVGEGDNYCLSCGEKVGFTMDMCGHCYTPIVKVRPNLIQRIKRKFKNR